MMITKFNITEWVSQFAIDLSGPRLWAPLAEGVGISGPPDVVMLEALRAEVRNRVSLGDSIPARLHVFRCDDELERRVSKVGGTPFRPNIGWPTRSNGEPMIFLAQFWLAKSPVETSNLPGDVLLVFAEDIDLCIDDPQEYLRFEWYNTDLITLMSPTDVPPAKRQFVNAIGVPYDTVDFPNPLAVSSVASIIPSDVLCHRWFSATKVCRAMGMKIGGAPIIIRDGKLMLSTSALDGYLGSLSTIVPRMSEGPWLWEDQSAYDHSSRLDIDGGFILNFWHDRSNGTRWEIGFWSDYEGHPPVQ